MLKKIAAFSLTAALAFSAPVVAMAQTDTATPMATPDAGASPEAMPMKHKMKSHKMKSHKMKSHKMKKKMMSDAPAGDAAPAADAPK